jgi:hypothetical protein
MVVLDQFEQQSLPPCFFDSEETRMNAHKGEESFDACAAPSAAR